MVLQALVLIIDSLSQPEMAVLFLFLTTVSCSPFWWRFPALFLCCLSCRTWQVANEKRKHRHNSTIFMELRKKRWIPLKVSCRLSLSLPPPLSISHCLSIYFSLSLSLSLSRSLSLSLSLSLSHSLSLSLSLSFSLCLVNRCWVLLTPCSVPVDVLCLLVLVSVGSVNPCVYMLSIDCWLSCAFYKASLKRAPLGPAGGRAWS